MFEFIPTKGAYPRRDLEMEFVGTSDPINPGRAPKTLVFRKINY
jgi:hypothetical protein